MLKVMVLGYGPLGLALVRGVLACSHLAQAVGVFPWSSHPGERHYQQEREEYHFRTFLKQQRLPVVQAGSVNHFAFVKLLNQLSPHVVLVGSWGEIFKPHVLEIPGIRFINCHPSLLPMHRGANPYTSVLMAGDDVTGVSFHRLDEGIDTGPLLMQRPLTINPGETGASLRQRCASLAESMVPELLQGLVDNTLTETPQTGLGSYDIIRDTDTWINWQSRPEDIERRIRALYPWFNSYAMCGSYLVAFGFGRLIKPNGQPTQSPPGTICQMNRQGIVVSTLNSDRPLQLEHPRLVSVPGLLNPVVWPFILRPGRCLSGPSSPQTP